MSAVTCLLIAQAVAAQPQVTLPEPKLGTVPNLTPVAVPPPYAVAFSETLGMLAFAHDRVSTEAHLSLVKLDAKGNPAINPISWKLPKAPEVLTKLGHYAVTVAFHPKLPLLYVWQDVAANYSVPLTSLPPELKVFDHLLIYSVAKETPELLVSLIRGEDVQYGMGGGALAADAAGEYLYTPNLRDKSGWMHFGRFRLDADGLPIVDEMDTKLPLPARLKKLAERNVAPKTLLPPQQNPVEYQYLHPLNTWGNGHCYHLVSKDVIVVGGTNGLMTWRPEDKDAVVHGLPLKNAGHVLFTAHPTLPYLFATPVNNTTDAFFRVAHNEGYLSLLPLQITLPNTRLSSAPVVFDKGTRIAVGGHYHVYIVALDAKGNPQPAVMKVPVLNPNVRTLVYSPKFDRLYVGVEVSK